MKSKKDFFEVNPPAQFDAKIEKLSAELLAQNQKQTSRRKAMQWFLVPALACMSLILTWRSFKSKQAPNMNLLDFAEWSSTEAGDFELVSELDFLENLDELEKWEDT